MRSFNRVIDRRAFLAGTGAVLLAAPLAAEAQQAARVARIGFLAAKSSGIATSGKRRRGSARSTLNKPRSCGGSFSCRLTASGYSGSPSC